VVTARILIVDDEASLRKVLAAALRREGHDVVLAEDAIAALGHLRQSTEPDVGEPFHLVISDVRMPGMDGMELLSVIQARHKDLPVVMLTAHGTVDMAVQALKHGAFDFLTKPYERDELMAVVNKAIAHRARDVREPTSESGSDDGRTLIGQSPKMRVVMDAIDKVADSPSTVLIMGESGTGKELAALALHRKSSRRDKPFIRINVAAIPPTLIEAELFGHEKGAFTGAVTQKPGRFELAHGGSLFLDEIGELQVDMQVKLLRVLQESTFERVGGVKTLQVDVRLIAATNRDLQKAIAAGDFREDLFYRLNVVPLQLPPLRERTTDLPLLVESLRKKLNRRLNKQVTSFGSDAMHALQQYHWPGNIRELENLMERTLLFCESAVIGVSDLPPDFLARVQPVGATPAHDVTTSTTTPRDGTDLRDGSESMKDIVRLHTERLERELIQRALEETHANVTHAARRLKISRKSLQIKMKETSDSSIEDDDTDRMDP
jgi:two-component system, NtrC family, response regulator AtoC